MDKQIKDITSYRQRLFEQKQILQDAVKQLKTELIGIDTVIDQVAEAVSPWLYFPEMQDRPVIINLWGLTGTGKTSLVKRLSELIGFSDRYFRFDLGESTKTYYGVQDTFRDIYESSNGEPFIIGLDEFQHARTINEDSEEIDKASSRSIWDLLDSGKFDMIDFEYNVSWFNKLIKCLDRALEKGVEVENGYITANKAVYDEIMQSGNGNSDNDTDDETGGVMKKTYFVSDDNLRTIYDMVDFMYLSKGDLRQKLDEMNGEETLAFLVYLYKKSIRPKTIDCTQALVFVMGNLDEVYTMNRNLNPDMSANEFHRQSCRITITQVKEALLARFRSEQIARLGNTHIIYPTLNEQAFYDIIRLELDKVRRKVQDTYGLEMQFDERVEELIYGEGVFPTQGTRPLFTTIHQIVNTRLGKILNEIYLNGIPVDTLWFTVRDEDIHTSATVNGTGIKAASCTGKATQQPEKALPANTATDAREYVSLQIDFVKDGETVHSLIDRQLLVLGKLRKAKKDDEQAIIAVHESGHAILSTVLMRTLPDSVFSVTADSGSGGFVFARPDWNYISKKEIVNRLAMLLGGFVAERIVFGEDNVTMGSGSDLQQATQLATQVIYSCGMGNTRAAFGNQHTDHAPAFILDSSNDGINKQAEELLSKAEELAQQTLEKQKLLLLKMADYLSDNRSANKATVRKMVEKYAIDFSLGEVVENGQHLFYREHLKKLAGEL